MTGGNAACGVFPRHRARRVQRELANVPRRRTERQDRHRLRGAHSHTLHRDTAVRRLLQGGENPAASYPPLGGVDAAAGVNDTGLSNTLHIGPCYKHTIGADVSRSRRLYAR